MKGSYIFNLKNDIKVKRKLITTDCIITVLEVYGDDNSVRGNNFKRLEVFSKSDSFIINIKRIESEEITTYIQNNIKNIWNVTESLIVNKGFSSIYTYNAMDIDRQLGGIEDRIISMSKVTKGINKVCHALLRVNKGDYLIFRLDDVHSEGILSTILFDDIDEIRVIRIPLRTFSECVSPSRSY